MKVNFSPKLRGYRATALRAQGRDSPLALRNDTCVQFWKFERTPHIGIRFVLCIDQCGRMVHNDRDISWLGFRPKGLARWHNSDRRQAE
jgi:hypothetical protein